MDIMIAYLDVHGCQSKESEETGVNHVDKGFPGERARDGHGLVSRHRQAQPLIIDEAQTKGVSPVGVNEAKGLPEDENCKRNVNRRGHENSTDL